MSRNTNNSVQALLVTPPKLNRNMNSFSINITPFNGDPDNLNFFIQQCNLIIKANKWSDDKSVAFIQSKLSGPALTYIIQKCELQPCDTPVQIFDALRAHFIQSNLCKSITEFNSITMIQGESIRNLAHRMDILAPRAHPQVKDSNALDAIKFNKFISIIPNDFRMHILQSEISQYAPAVNKAALLQDCKLSNEAINFNTSSSPIQEIRKDLSMLKESIQNLNSAHSEPTQDSKSFRNNNKNNDKLYHRHSQKYSNQHKFSKYQGYNNRKFNKRGSFQHRHNNNVRQRFPAPNSTSVQQNNNYPYNSTAHTHFPAIVICQFCQQIGHECRFCPSFSSYFTRRSTVSQPSVSMQPENAHTYSSQSSLALMPIQQHEASVNAIHGSELNPAAAPFQPSPNW